MVPNDDDIITIGRITSPHGIKGWVKVFSYTDPIEQIFEYLPWQLSLGRKSRNLEVQEWRRQGKALVALPEGFESRNDADLLAGWEIRISKQQLPDLTQGEFYWHELEGLVVVNQQSERLGRVDHLLETGANDVLVVKPTQDSIDQQERLIPYVEGEIVKQVELESGTILVDWEKEF